MGICKCKKRTDLFCFIHRKAVCEACICSDHKLCIVKTYVDWLTDLDYEPAACGICKEKLNETDPVLRLMCLDMFHPECVNVYASALPPHTAKAGYLCPTCSKPMFPPDVDNPLAKEVTDYLTRSSWSSNILTGKTQHENLSDPMIQTNEEINSIHKSQTNSQAQSNQQLFNQPQTNIGGESTTDSSNFSSVASRKTAREHNVDTSINIMDEDEDKYKKKSVMQLFLNLGLIPAQPLKGSRQTRIRLDKRRIFILIGLLSSLFIVIFLASSMISDISETEINE